MNYILNKTVIICSCIVSILLSIVMINYFSIACFNYNYIPKNNALYFCIGILGILWLIGTIYGICFLNKWI
jgi:hypothetical protein